MTTLRIVSRLFIEGKLDSEEPLEVPEGELENLIPDVARRQAVRVLGRPFMVEIELLDWPEENRFLRFGTDPRHMVQPIPISTDEGPAN